jgi:acyl transferase domain-containing protein
VFLLGEGAGAVLLQPLSQAIADGNAILAVIKPLPGRDGDDVGSAHMIELDSDARLPEATTRGSAIGAAHACSAEMIVLSANTPDALRVLAWRLLDRIKRGTLGTAARNGSGASLMDLACTLQSCREEMNCRLAMVVSGFEELVRGLEEYLLGTDGSAAVVQKILAHTRAGVPITVYRGDLDKSTQVTSLLSGSAGEAMVKALLLEGDLGNLALCWVQGAKVDWKDLQKGKSPHKAALPGYPFSISKQERQLLRDGVSSLRLSESELASDGIRSASVGAVESALTAIWKELFGLERIGRHQNFFELGGNSQLGMHMISRVRDAMQVDLPLSYLYETLTIAKMSEKIAHLAALSAMPFDVAGAENDNDYEVGIIR